MFTSEGSTKRVAARLQDYFGRRTPWQRRLWNIGSVLTLRETIEAAQYHRNGHLRQGSLRDLAESSKVKVGRDPGVGGSDLRRSLQSILGTIESDDRALAELQYLTSKVESGYLERWHRVVQEQADLGAEYVSRILGSHLLDLGFSPDHLHRWITSLEHNTNATLDLAGLFAEAADLSARPKARFDVLVPMLAMPKAFALPHEWLSATDVNNWLNTNSGSPAGVRQNGGFLFSIQERDPWAAVERAGDIVRSLGARVAVGLPGQPSFSWHPEAWVAGKATPFGLSTPRRQVDIHALNRQNVLFTIGLPGLGQQLSSALELLSALETSTPGTAVASGWAAVETLLSRSGAPNVSAADDLALLVACSFPRAELTTLSHRYAQEHRDSVTEQLASVNSNRDRAAVFADGIASQQVQPVPGLSDTAALARMAELLATPRATLERIHGYASEAFRRLYRQRNLILHAGTTESVALRPVLRTVPPLVGAGIDRIVHAALASPPQSSSYLVARAAAEIGLVGGASGIHLVDLLGA